jgi:phosphomannomutase
MPGDGEKRQLFAGHVVAGDHRRSDYFGLIRALLHQPDGPARQEALTEAYTLLRAEIRDSRDLPQQPIAFGTSGWRGRLGKDISVRSVLAVTLAIVRMYEELAQQPELARLLGVVSAAEARQRGCVLGFDNRFAGELLAGRAAAALIDAGFTVHYAGESTTGVLSAAVLRRRAAFSINLTPSHNPLEYGGYKFNAADAGPAAAPVTARITANAQAVLAGSSLTPLLDRLQAAEGLPSSELFNSFDALAEWQALVAANEPRHGLALDGAVASFLARPDLVVAVDAVHGASRLHLRRLFGGTDSPRLFLLRDTADVTFGGVAPEPSWQNLQPVVSLLRARPERLKLGAIIDPDGDRIRFTDGSREIGMNAFGAMAYHFLHQHKGKQGMVAKTVATSNLANSLARAFGERLFEPAVGFKNFREVVGQALVCFEESDGITVIGHTPEKDAYIGLLLALEMVLATGKNLGDYLDEIEREYGAYFPDRDGIAVADQGAALAVKLERLAKFQVGDVVEVGGEGRRIAEVIAIDGRKLVFEDGSWLMVRPSGTEPKVRFYVESRTRRGTEELVAAAKELLVEAGVL